MLRTCTIRPNVRIHLHCTPIASLTTAVAKKEDNPEQALKDFRAIVDQEEEKGDW